MSFNFILQATRLLNVGNYDEDELKMIFEFFISLDKELLNYYQQSCTILTYNNDLELYVEIIDILIKIFEDREEYEKCTLLMKKKEEANKLLNKL